MNIGPKQRKALLWSALLLTLAATAYTWHVENQSPQVVAPLAAETETDAQNPASREDAPPPATLQPWQQRALEDSGRDIFQTPRKEPDPPPAKAEAAPPPPPPVPVAPPPPPPPSAPPLALSYLGKLGEDGKYTVFLSMRGKNYAVKAGDVIAQTYRVEEIRPPQLTVTYLPLNIQQTLRIGEP